MTTRRDAIIRARLLATQDDANVAIHRDLPGFVHDETSIGCPCGVVVIGPNDLRTTEQIEAALDVEVEA